MLARRRCHARESASRALRRSGSNARNPTKRQRRERLVARGGEEIRCQVVSGRPATPPLRLKLSKPCCSRGGRSSAAHSATVWRWEMRAFPSAPAAVVALGG
eukprot:365214-Chlamydomonas_euryale.AAC.20